MSVPEFVRSKVCRALVAMLAILLFLATDSHLYLKD